MKTLGIGFVVLLAWVCLSAQAQSSGVLHRCVDRAGKATIQDSPCPAKQQDLVVARLAAAGGG